MDVALSTLFNLYQFSTGRYLFALNQVSDAIDNSDADLSDIRDHIGKAIKHGASTRALENMFAASKAVPKGSKVVAIDLLADRTLVAIRDGAQSEIDAGGDDDLGKRAQQLLVDCFPRGVQAVTQATFVDELSAIQGILGLLQGKHKETVKDLGLSRYATRLSKIGKDYDVALKATPEKGVDYSQVRAARQRSHEFLLEVVAMIIGRYPLTTDKHVATRQHLLAPILAQNEAIAVYLRSRRTIEDVDPETGETQPTSPVADAPAVTPATDISHQPMD